MTTEQDCIFCRIASGEIPADVVAEGLEWLAFRDLSPQAPTHVLVIPRGHVTSLDDPGAGVIGFGDALLAGCRKAAEATGVAGGYRVVTNTGPEGGQEVMHLHLHVLGGRQMGWPPG
jgi:histidine triad (HIT) family protein